MHDALLTLHRWAGLILGLLILVIALTGSILVFENDIDAALNSQLMFSRGPGVDRISLDVAVDAVRRAYPNDPPTSIRVEPFGFALERRTIELSLASGLSAFVDPWTGEVLGTRSRAEGAARFIHLLHTRFVAGQPGEYVVGAITAVTCLMALSGLYLWWPRKLLAMARTRSWRRTNLDLHHLLGFYSSLVMLVMTLTGVIIAFEDYFEPLWGKLNSAPVRLTSAESTPIEGATPISVDDAVRLANAALPGAHTTSINLPPPGKATYRAAMKFPEDRTPAGRSRVTLDQWNGAVLQAISTREAELGTMISNLKRSLHTGDVWGWPTQALYFVACLAIAGQVVTGFLMWWKPGKLALGPRAARASAVQGKLA